MKKARQVFWMAGVEFRKFLTVKNLILMLFSLIFLGESVIGKMVSVSVETGIQMNYLEPINLILCTAFVSVPADKMETYRSVFLYGIHCFWSCGSIPSGGGEMDFPAVPRNFRNSF